MTIKTLLVSAALVGTLSAQDISAVVTTSPVFLAANAGGASDTDLITLTQAASGGGNVLAVDAPLIAFGNAGFTATTDGELERRYTYSIRGFALANGPGAMSIGAHQVLIELTSAVPRFVSLSWTVSRSATGGSLPTFDVDVGDDGVLDESGANAGVVLGPQPFLISISAQGLASSQVGQFANFLGSFQLLAKPVNSLNILQAVQGCGPGAFISESFEGSGVHIQSPASELVVLGFAAQPTLLPNNSQSQFPCLLYPQPDIVQLLPFDGIVVPLPPAVRPANFFIQTVDFIGSGDVRTSPAFWVNAF